LKPRTPFGRLQGQKLKNKPVSWVEHLPDTEVNHILSKSHDHNHTTTDTQRTTRPKTRPIDYRNKHRRYETNRLCTTRPSVMPTMAVPKNRTFYSQNKRFLGNIRAYHRACKGNNFENNIDRNIYNHIDSLSPLFYPVRNVKDRLNRRDFTRGTFNTMEHQ